MEVKEREWITVDTTINSPIEKVWDLWTSPEHIIHWNNASDDWHTPKAENDLKVGGKFVFKMEAKNGSFGFEFEGVYTEVKPNELIAYKMGDGRNAKIKFTSDADKTKIIETFEAEDINTIDLQRNGWQAILNNFKKYVEAN
ncbi:SRPBCC family protein [Pedobacter cryophilus]|uniref:Polyketide cyclase n=1 Tax=Pedobacter cryophilus TaxID=2571271 RepID=A0A4U1C952_9SPHI|nr:SRPBCC family protein [Pedobacter cryophilus]TKC00158.1 polyketide cyclase [Pedobacter cryophilus]